MPRATLKNRKHVWPTGSRKQNALGAYHIHVDHFLAAIGLPGQYSSVEEMLLGFQQTMRNLGYDLEFVNDPTETRDIFQLMKESRPCPD